MSRRYLTRPCEYGTRIGIAAIVLLLALIGGRIIPSFTRNWLARENPGRLPAPFGRFDGATIAVSAVTTDPVGGAASRTAERGRAHGRRAAEYRASGALVAGDRTFRDRLVLILHVGYLFVPLGFLLAGLAALDMIVASAAIHAWMVGRRAR